MKSPPDPRYRHRFPAEIIRHALWLYHVFTFSLRDIKLRWLSAASSSPRSGCGAHTRIGGHFAGCLRRHRPQPGDK